MVGNCDTKMARPWSFFLLMVISSWLCIFLYAFTQSGGGGGSSCGDGDGVALLPQQLTSKDDFQRVYLSPKRLPRRVVKRPPSRRKNVLIGVLTCEKNLPRATAISKTWGHGFTNTTSQTQIYFFVGENCKSCARLKLPIVKLRGIRDGQSSHQEKVIAVLKYLHKQHGAKFRWFLRVDDDVYMQVNKLEAKLQELDWTMTLELGHPSYGRGDGGGEHKMDCMGGAGVVFSASALQLLSLHLDECLKAARGSREKELGWFNEDVELGKCVGSTVGINCSDVIKVSVVALCKCLKKNNVC